ncbi:hypothetical protein Tco_0472277 [Tanacetum coccineum]
MHQTFEKSSLAMTHKLDDMIKLPKWQPKKTYEEDLECEIVMVKMPRFMAWLGFTDACDEHIGSLEVEETLGTPIEVEPLEEKQLEDLGLNTCNYEIPLTFREVPSVDEQGPQPLPNFPSLDVNLGDKRGPEPPIKPHNLDSFRMKLIDPLTIHTPPSPRMAPFKLKDVY